MDPFAITVKELNVWLAGQLDDARVVVTPPKGRSFPLLGHCASADGRTIILTGAEGSYDTEPES